jgi:hypothetical protein
VLRHLAFITPNANELLAIAAATGQQELASSSSSSSSSRSSSQLQPSALALEQVRCPQQLLAQLAPAATTVLLQGEPGCWLHQVLLKHHALGPACIRLQDSVDQHQLSVTSQSLSCNLQHVATASTVLR